MTLTINYTIIESVKIKQLKSLENPENQECILLL